MKTLKYLILSILFLSSCDKFDWHNPYDPECPKELFTPSSPGAAMEGNSVKLTWSQQNDDISGFALFRSAEGESITNLTQTQKTTTQYIDASITPGKKYTYYVVAVAGTNKSDTVKAEIIPVIPVTITTGSVTELAATSAKVSGNITNAGGGTVTSRGICWSTTPNPTVNSSKTTEGTGAGEFTSTLTNLLAGTTYFARAYGENSRGISYGSEISFTTLGPPKLTTTAVSNITATTATSGGTIISDGGSPITAKGVVWSTSPNPTIDLVTKTNDGTGVGAFTSTMSNLTNNTKYYLRAYATNIVGTTYGEEQSFTTSTPVPPILESLKQGLVAYYPFNGNAGDSSGNGNHGTLVNNISFTNDPKGVANSALNMLGGSNGGRVTTNTNVFSFQFSDSYTLAFWVLERPVNNNGRLFSTENPEGAFRIASYRNGVYAIAFGAEPYLYDTVAFNTWNHIVFAYRNGVGQLYKNGKLKGEYQFLNSGVFQHNVFTIGTKAAPAFDAWNGCLDELRVYNRVLSLQEVEALFLR